jgi:RNA polymerase sigma-70 factor (ECF subfamily)
MTRRQPSTIDGACAPRVASGVAPSESVVVEMLIERLAPTVYRVAHALTGSTVQAGAVVREVLLRALRERLPVPEGRRLGTALYRYAVNAALARRSDREAPSANGPAGDTSWRTSLPRFGADGHRDGTDVLVDWSAQPDAVLLAGARRVVRETLDRLPDAERAALVLADAEGLSIADIAEILGWPDETVRCRVHQARMVVRERVSQRLASDHAA